MLLLSGLRSILTNKAFRRTVIVLTRLFMGIVFIVGGFESIIDPVGAEILADGRLRAAGLDALLPLSLVFAVLVSSIRFMIGACLVIGANIRSIAVYLLIFSLVEAVSSSFFTPDVSCLYAGTGTFNTTLSNTWLVVGDIYFILMSVLLFVWRRYNIRLFTVRTEWTISIYSFFFGILVSVKTLFSLPAIDLGKMPLESDFLENAKIAEKNVNNGNVASRMTDWEQIEKCIDSHTRVLLLLSNDISEASTHSRHRLNDMYDYAASHEIGFFCLCGNDPDSEEAEEYVIESAGAEYQFVYLQPEVAKCFCRSNPELYLLEKGTVIGKWSVYKLPENDEDLYTYKYEDNKRESSQVLLFFSFVIFIIPLLVILMYDYLVELILYIFGRGKKKDEDDKEENHTDVITEEENIEQIINEISNDNINNNKAMRKKIVAGNWKMNLNLQEGIALATELNDALKADKPNCDVVICTPFIHLAKVADILDQNIIGLGAENCAVKEKGAYTGEVSAEQIKSTGAQYVILGHSERRFGANEGFVDTPEILKEKVLLAQKNGLKVIFCIGESKEEREAGIQNEIVKLELARSVFNLSAEEFSKIVIAYEPIWAIGTGLTATSDQAEEIHAYIRSAIAEKYGKEIAENTSILYGGSCKASNAPELFSKPNIDGGLIGGASLKCADFKGIIDAFKK